MRVIAGEAKGRPLVAARGGGTRSATDRIRETLFAILADRVVGAAVLDLFAGAGTVGIEALSRGAARATFVERSAGALVALRENLARTGLGDRGEVVPANVLAWLDAASGPKERSDYDLAFCDPPFADVGLLEATLAHRGLAGSLSEDAIVVARIHRKHRPALPAHADLVREKEIGEESLLFLRYRPEERAGGLG
jgi:16S rRNA (guanine(966)-N(2))-methyltransferase RsmD